MYNRSDLWSDRRRIQTPSIDSEQDENKMQKLEWESQPRENEYHNKTRDFINSGVIESFQKPWKKTEYT